MAETCLIANCQSEINISINIDDIDTDKDIDHITTCFRYLYRNISVYMWNYIYRCVNMQANIKWFMF